MAIAGEKGISRQLLARCTLWFAQSLSHKRNPKAAAVFCSHISILTSFVLGAASHIYSLSRQGIAWLVQSFVI
jgi:hypothetical protein